MKTQAEDFLYTILRISNNEKGNLRIEFKDRSVVDYNIDSCKFKLSTKPMAEKNITKTGSIEHGVEMRGEILKNGAEVIRKEHCTDGSGYVILTRRKTHNINKQFEFITWITDNEMNCFYGNYFNDAEKANLDYWKRVDEYCKE